MLMIYVFAHERIFVRSKQTILYIMFRQFSFQYIKLTIYRLFQSSCNRVEQTYQNLLIHQVHRWQRRRGNAQLQQRYDPRTLIDGDVHGVVDII